jgi:hypothetical protein
MNTPVPAPAGTKWVKGHIAWLIGLGSFILGVLCGALLIHLHH